MPDSVQIREGWSVCPILVDIDYENGRDLFPPYFLKLLNEDLMGSTVEICSVNTLSQPKLRLVGGPVVELPYKNELFEEFNESDNLPFSLVCKFLGGVGYLALLPDEYALLLIRTTSKRSLSVGNFDMVDRQNRALADSGSIDFSLEQYGALRRLFAG